MMTIGSDINRIRNLSYMPLGAPLYWVNEKSGVLKAAIGAFYAHILDGEPIKKRHVSLVRAYLIYVINAPCWMAGAGEDFASQVQSLKDGIQSADTPKLIDEWIEKCLEIGIDPL